MKKQQLTTKYIVTFLIAGVFMLGCKKNNNLFPLNDGSISFHLPADKDTIQIPLSILRDSALVLGFQAALVGNASSSAHWINFSVDTTRMNEYRARFGKAELLPYTSYLFYKNTAMLSPGSMLSDSAIVNIGQQTKLSEYTTYVLPVKIESVDGNTDATTNRIVYYVFKTGRPLFIKKIGWTVVDFSSEGSAIRAVNVVDNELSTYWGTNTAQKMPQWVTINFSKDIIFSAVSYSFPSNLRYPTRGGYPTSIKIETSLDGTSWTYKGTFAGNLVNLSQKLDIGLTTAKYLKFTVLESVKFANAFDAVFLSDITLMP